MRCLGVDFGEKFVGVAISDEKGRIATPLATVHRKNDRQVVKRLVEICEQYRCVNIVVGLPYPMHDVHYKQYERILRFVEKLREYVVSKSWHIVTHAENLSTNEARKLGAKSPEQINRVAAAIILQRYLDSVRGSTKGIKGV